MPIKWAALSDTDFAVNLQRCELERHESDKFVAELRLQRAAANKSRSSDLSLTTSARSPLSIGQPCRAESWAARLTQLTRDDLIEIAAKGCMVDSEVAQLATERLLASPLRARPGWARQNH